MTPFVSVYCYDNEYFEFSKENNLTFDEIIPTMKGRRYVMKRWIMHVDMDAFFASVEQRDHPEWRGKPVIVGGKAKRGVVATASYEARAFGVRSAMPSAKAHELCPDGVFVAPRMDVYKRESAKIHEIMLHYAPAIEPISLDEAFMDISGLRNHYSSVDAVGRAIKEEIREKTGLIASAGIAPNKFLAKMASDMGKPDGLFIIPYGKEIEVLAPLPIRKLWGVGHVTEKKFIEMGIETIGDLQKTPTNVLKSILGNQAGMFKKLSLGIDNRPIESRRAAKSIGDESTYETDMTDENEINRQIALHSDVVAQRLRKQKLAGRTISLKIRFASFRTVTRSITLEVGTDLQEDIYEAAMKLKEKIYFTEGVRLIGITASNLCPPVETIDLFSDKREKQSRAERVMDKIQDLFGKNALRRAIWLEEEKRKNQSDEKEE